MCADKVKDSCLQVKGVEKEADTGMGADKVTCDFLVDLDSDSEGPNDEEDEEVPKEVGNRNSTSPLVWLESQYPFGFVFIVFCM